MNYDKEEVSRLVEEYSDYSILKVALLNPDNVVEMRLREPSDVYELLYDWIELLVMPLGIFSRIVKILRPCAYGSDGHLIYGSPVSSNATDEWGVGHYSSSTGRYEYTTLFGKTLLVNGEMDNDEMDRFSILAVCENKKLWRIDILPNEPVEINFPT